MAKIYKNVTELIGGTPLLEVKNIEAAENAGMQGIVFHDAGQLREELKARGIL